MKRPLWPTIALAALLVSWCALPAVTFAEEPGEPPHDEAAPPPPTDDELDGPPPHGPGQPSPPGPRGFQVRFERSRHGERRITVQPFSAEQRSELLERLRQHDPLLAERIENAAREHPDAADRIFTRVGDRVEELDSAREADPETYGLHRLQMQILRARIRLVREYHKIRSESDEPQLESLSDQIRENIREHLAVRREIRQKQLEELQRQLAEMRAELEQWQEQVDEMVEKHFERVTTHGPPWRRARGDDRRHPGREGPGHPPPDDAGPPPDDHDTPPPGD